MARGLRRLFGRSRPASSISLPSEIGPQHSAIVSSANVHNRSEPTQQGRRVEAPKATYDPVIDEDGTAKETVDAGQGSRPVQLDVWQLSYDDFRASNPELAQICSEIFAARPIDALNAHTTKRLSYLPSSLEIALDKVQAIYDNRSILHGRSAPFREAFEETAHLVISSRAAFTELASSAHSYAVSALAGVGVLLPHFLENPQETQAALEGLRLVAILVVAYWWDGKLFPVSDTSHMLCDGLRKLYLSLFEYESRLHEFFDGQRYALDRKSQFKAQEWDHRRHTLAQLDLECRAIMDSMVEPQIIAPGHQRRTLRDSILSQPSFEAMKAHLQLLYCRYEAAKDINDVKAAGTLEWFFKHPKYLSWRTAQSSCLLWLTAEPGCGKSVLSRYFVDRETKLSALSQRSSQVCYFFFRSGDAELMRPITAIKALLHQLFIQKPALYTHVAQDIEEKGSRCLEDFDTLWSILLAIFHDESIDELTCVIDALDECQDAGQDRKKLISNLVKLQKSFANRRRTKATRRILITSRPYLELERELRELTSMSPGVRFAGEEESAKIGQEINLVMSQRLMSLAQKLELAPRVRETLYEHLASMKHRTYLWLTLMFDFIETRTEISARTIPHLLKEIPRTVEDAYNKLLSRLENATRTRKLLHYILAAATPLRLSDINVLMNLTEDCRTIGDIEMWPEGKVKSIVRSICGLFVSVIGSRVYLIHETARAFLTRQLTEYSKLDSTASIQQHGTDLANASGNYYGQIQVSGQARPVIGNIYHVHYVHPSGNGIVSDGSEERADCWKSSFDPQESALSLSQACVSFLSLEFRDKQSTSRILASRRTDDQAGSADVTLFTYAARYWPIHLTEAGSLVNIDLCRHIAQRLFDPSRVVFKLWLEEHARHVERNSQMPLEASGLLWAAYFGLAPVLECLIGNTTNLEAKDQLGRTALAFAVEQGQEQAVRLLLSRGALLDVPNVLYQTPLLLSLQGRHFRIFEMLLASGADVRVTDVFGRYVRCHENANGPYGLGTVITDQEQDQLSPKAEDSSKANIAAVDSAPTVEQVLELLKEYITQKHEVTKEWVSVAKDTLLLNKKTKKSAGLSTAYDSLVEATEAFEAPEQLFEQERHYAFTAFAALRTIIQNESPLLPLYIPRMLAYLWSHKLQRIARAVATQLSTHALDVYGGTYPLSLLLASISTLLESLEVDMQYITSSIFGALTVIWSTLLGKDHYQCGYTQHVARAVELLFYEPSTLTAKLTSLSTVEDSAHGQCSIIAIQTRVDLAQNLLQACNLVAARDTAVEVCSRITNFTKESSTSIARPVSDFRPHIRIRSSSAQRQVRSLPQNTRIIHLFCEALRVIAEAEAQLANVTSAEEAFEELILTSESMLGQYHKRTRAHASAYEKFLRAQGRKEEAAELSMYS